MDKQKELELTRELGELRRLYTLCDKSDENIKRGKRIKEIMEELSLGCKPRKNYRPPIIRYR